MASNKMKDLLLISEGKDGKKFWNKVGVVFENKDGSLNIKCNYPVVIGCPGVDCQIRARLEKESGGDTFE